MRRSDVNSSFLSALAGSAATGSDLENARRESSGDASRRRPGEERWMILSYSTSENKLASEYEEGNESIRVETVS